MAYDKENTRPARSSAYQYVIAEIAVDTDFLCSFNNSQSIEHHLNPYRYDDQLLEAKDQLKKEFWKLVDSIMTERQKVVLHGLADGYTQVEIAKMSNVNQSSITKTLNGNIDYKNGERLYGGAIKKLKNAIKHHKPIQDLLTTIAELQEERY